MLKWLKAIGIVLGFIVGIITFVLLAAFFFIPMLFITAFVSFCFLVKTVHDEMD